jgi:hypothetical protein
MRRITDLASSTSIVENDLIEIVDINDFDMSETGTNKSVTAELLANSLTKMINDDVDIVVSSDGNAVKISQSGDGNALLVYDENPDTSPFVITHQGNVGIGTLLPSANTKLDVVGAVKATSFVGPLTGNVTGDVTGNVTGNAGTVTNGVYTSGDQNIISNKTFINGSPSSAIITSINSTHGYPISVYSDDVSIAVCGAEAVYRAFTIGGTLSAPTAVGDNVVIGSIRAYAYNGSAFNGYGGGGTSGINFISKGVQSSTNSGGYISLHTTAENTGNTPAERMRIDHNGNVGIGTTNPYAKLEINSSASILPTLSSSITDVANALRIYGDGQLISTCGPNGPIRHFAIGGTVASPTAIADGVTTAGIYGFAYNGSTSGTTSAFNGYLFGGIGNVTISAKGAQTPTNGGSCITFSTTLQNTVNAPLERMRIDHNGNVGIGTASPSNTLHVSGNEVIARFSGTTNEYQGIVIQPTQSSASVAKGGFIDFKNENDIALTNLANYHFTDGSSDFNINTTPAGSRTTDRRVERLRIKGDGNVGIGTDDPKAKLHISGISARFDSAIHIAESTHATSRRASLTLGGWVIGQDAVGNGERGSFFFWDNNFGAGQFRGGFAGTANFMPNDNFYIANTANGAQYWYYNKQNTTGVVSDIRTKSDISTIDTDKALSFITSITPSTFRVASDLPIQAGFIAQDILSNAKTEDQKEIINNHNTYDENDPDCPILGVADRPIVAYLVAAMQEQQKIIDSLQSRLEILEAKTV